MQRALAVGHLGRRYRNGMGQSLRIDGNGRLIPETFLPTIALLASRVGVLHCASTIKNVPQALPLSLAGRANLIF